MGAPTWYESLRRFCIESDGTLRRNASFAAAVQRVFSKITDSLESINVTYAAPGDDLQAKITAQAAKATPVVRQLVEATPGVISDIETPDANVDLLYTEELINERANAAALRRRTNVSDYEPVFALPCGMIAVRNDDWLSGVYAALADLGADFLTGANFTPLRYAANACVPVSLSVPSVQVNGTGATNQAARQALIKAWWDGHPILAHGYDGAIAAYPTTDDDILNEVLRSKYELSNLAAETIASYPAGQAIPAVRCWVQPGQYGTNGMASLAKAQTKLAELVRRHYDCSMAYIQTDDPRHFRLGSQYTITSATTTAQIDAILDLACTPGARVTVVTHNVVAATATGDAILATTWKYLIDQIVARRNAGKLQPVSVPMLLCGKQPVTATAYTSDAPSAVRVGGINGGYIDTASTAPGNWMGIKLTTGHSTEESTCDIARRIGPTGYQIASAAAANPTLEITPADHLCLPGRTYQLSFDVKAANYAAGVASFHVLTAFYKNGESRLSSHPALVAEADKSTAGWHTVRAIFNTPLDMDKILIQVRRRLPDDDTNARAYKNFELIEL